MRPQPIAFLRVSLSCARECEQNQLSINNVKRDVLMRDLTKLGRVFSHIIWYHTIRI